MNQHETTYCAGYSSQPTGGSQVRRKILPKLRREEEQRNDRVPYRYSGNMPELIKVNGDGGQRSMRSVDYTHTDPILPDLHKEQFAEIKVRRYGKPRNMLPVGKNIYTVNKSGIYEQDFEAEAVRDYAYFADGYKYLVKWKGWSEKDNTWEPAKHLLNCKEILLKFYMKRRQEYFLQVRDTSSENVKKIILEPLDPKHRLVSKEIVSSASHLTSLLPPDPRLFSEICTEFVKYFPITKEDLMDGVAEFGTQFQKPVVNLPELSLLVGKALFKLSRPSSLKYIRDILIKVEIWKRAGDLNCSLKMWENELNRRSEGKPVIQVENKVNLEYPPEYFIYFNLSEDIRPVQQTRRSSGCFCKNRCFERRRSCCGTAFGAEFVYNRSGRLIVPPGTPIYECNDNCDCDHECPNRVVQDGFQRLKDMHYCIFRTQNKGWGVKTLKSIRKGTFTMLLVGEIITSEEACRRYMSPDQEVGKYFLDLDFYGDSSFVIDFSCKGNISHFINHSCNPNLAMYSNWYNSVDPFLPRIALYATVDIPPNTELTYSYVNVEEFRTRYGPELEDGIIPEGFAKCFCGSTNCVKFMMFPN